MLVRTSTSGTPLTSKPLAFIVSRLALLAPRSMAPYQPPVSWAMALEARAAAARAAPTRSLDFILGSPSLPSAGAQADAYDYTEVITRRQCPAGHTWRDCGGE